jgi:hypothetical protein
VYGSSTPLWSRRVCKVVVGYYVWTFQKPELSGFAQLYPLNSG